MHHAVARASLCVLKVHLCALKCSVCIRAHRLRQGSTLDVLSYVGLNKENRERVEEYFNYITHYSHPAGEGIAFLNELPKPLFEEVTGGAPRLLLLLLLLHACSCLSAP